jgi:hypothetical protein
VSGALLKHALACLAEDIERAGIDLASVVCGACEALDCFDPDIVHDLEAIQELHSNVRAVIDGALGEYRWQIPRALRAFREALAPAHAGGR